MRLIYAYRTKGGSLGRNKIWPLRLHFTPVTPVLRPNAHMRSLPADPRLNPRQVLRARLRQTHDKP